MERRFQTFAGSVGDDKREIQARLLTPLAPKRAQLEIKVEKSPQKIARIKKDSGSAR
jgi:hypothetical protein